MATEKTIPWGADNPGNIKLSADRWSGNEDVTVTSDENLGILRSKPVVFYSKENGNIVSPPVNIVQKQATARAYWYNNNNDTIELNTSGGTSSFDVITNVSSKDYIQIETVLPAGWSLSDGVPISGGWRYTLTYTKSGIGTSGAQFKITVGRLEPIIIDCTQDAKAVIRSEYTRWSTSLNSMGYVPLTGFYNNTQIGAGGATWSVCAISKTRPTRTRTDYYNNGEVVTAQESMPDDMALIPIVIHTATTTKRQILTNNGTTDYMTTCGDYLKALATVGCGVLFRATSLGSTYYDANDVGLGSYSGVAYGLQVVDNDTNATYTVFSSRNDIPEQSNVVESYNTAIASGTWAAIMNSGTGESYVPLIGIQSLLWSVTAMFRGTFTSGATAMVNAPSIRVKIDANSPTVPDYPTVIQNESEDLTAEQAASTTPIPRNLLLYIPNNSVRILTAENNNSAYAVYVSVYFYDTAGTQIAYIPGSRYSMVAAGWCSPCIVAFVSSSATGNQGAGTAFPVLQNESDQPNGYSTYYGNIGVPYSNKREKFTGTADSVLPIAEQPNYTSQTVGALPQAYNSNGQLCGWLIRLTMGAVIRNAKLANRYIKVEMGLSYTHPATWYVKCDSNGRAVLFPTDPATGRIYAWIVKEMNVVGQRITFRLTEMTTPDGDQYIPSA